MYSPTENAETETSLPSAAEELSALLDVLDQATGSVYLLLDRQFRVQRISGSVGLLGADDSSCLGKTLAEACPDLWLPLREILEPQRDLELPSITQHLTTAAQGTPLQVQHWRATCYSTAATTGEPCLGVLLVNFTQQQAVEAALRDSEERFRGAFDTAPGGMALMGPEGYLTRVSHSLCEFLGYAKEELLGKRLAHITHPDDLPAEKELVQQLFRGDIEHYRIEKRYVRQDGKIVWGLLSATGIRDLDGTTVGCLGQIQDITDLKAAYETLHQRENQYRTLAESIPTLVWITDGHGTPEYINERMLDYVGRDRVAELWPDWQRCIHPDDWISTAEQWQTSLVQQQPYELEYRFQRADGDFRWHIARAVPVFDEQGAVVRWFGTCTDIHTQKLAQQTLDASERRFRAILERSFDCVKLVTAEGIVDCASPSSSNLLGNDPTTRVGRPVFESAHPDDAAMVADQFAKILRSPGLPLKWAYRSEHADGTCRWLEAWGTNLLNDPNVGAVVINLRDVTQEKFAEASQQALRAERNQLLRRLQIQVDTMPVGLIVTDEQFRIIEWNSAAEKIFGYDKASVLGKRFQQVGLVRCDGPESIDGIAERLNRSSDAAHGLHGNLTRDGRDIVCEWYLTPLTGENQQFEGVLGMVVDVSERLHLEEQYRQAQKMEAVGRLAGGVAHDFNNLLTIINGYSELLLDEIEHDHHARSLLLEVQRAGDRAARLTDQLLSFSRKQILHQEVIDLRSVLHDMKSMLACLIGEDIELTIDWDNDLPCVRADKHQLEQVIMNLAANARDAMPCGGKLAIRLRAIQVEQLEKGEQEELPAGRYVQLCVTDTGEGMARETRERIFEPFFTTKEVGRGTGLGLATVYGIIRQAGGRIGVQSGAGQGTTFEVLLPAIESLGPVGHSILAQHPQGNGERILLVEDEASLRNVASQMLIQLGYQVVSVANGEEAIVVNQAAKMPFDLLFTDVVMPGMSGGELCQTLRQTCPGLKVIFMSGYTNDRLVQHDICEADSQFLQKPFSRAALAKIVSRMLAHAS